MATGPTRKAGDDMFVVERTDYEDDYKRRAECPVVRHFIGLYISEENAFDARDADMRTYLYLSQTCGGPICNRGKHHY